MDVRTCRAPGTEERRTGVSRILELGERLFKNWAGQGPHWGGGIVEDQGTPAPEHQTGREAHAQGANAHGANAHPLARSVQLTGWLAILGIAAAAGVVTGGFLGYLSQQSPIGELEYYKPSQVTRVYDRTGEAVVKEFYVEKRDVLPLAEMPSALVDAFIAIEDERFHQHTGVDPHGLLRALVVNARRGAALRGQGASTITQQMARTVLSETVGRDPTLRRKIREALVSLQIEQRYSKDQILEFFLNHTFLGYNSYGVQSAAHTYFGKDARDLTMAECASLAAIPQAPSKMNPFRSPEEHVKRRNVVLAKMRDLGMISDTVAAREMNSSLLVSRQAQPLGDPAPYFVDHLRRTLRENPQVQEDLLDREGYIIHSTVNLECQRILQEGLARGLRQAEALWQEAKPQRRADERRDLREKQGSVEPRVGQDRLASIRGIRPDGVEVEVEGRRGFAPFRKQMAPKGRSGQLMWTGEYVKPWFDPESALVEGKLIDAHIDGLNPGGGAMQVSLADRAHIQGAAVLVEVATGHILAMVGGEDFYDQENNGMWNRAAPAAGGGRQPGSAFKPLLYATAIESGFTAGTVIMDDRVEYEDGYLPRNYSNIYHGPTTLFRALSLSDNVVTVKLFRMLGFRKALAGYRALDIVEPRAVWKLRHELPVCLGSLNATPLSIIAAYLPFARQGLAIEPLCVTRVGRVSRPGQSEDVLKPRERRVFSPQTAYIVTAMLMDAVRNGTGKKSVGDHFDWTRTPQIAGKTGTTTDCVDAWFVGYSPELALVVYVGFDRVGSMGPGMTGSTVAAPVWRDIFKGILETRDAWKMEFNVPSDIVLCDIASQTGLLAPESPYSDEEIIRRVPFRKGTEPREESRGYSGFPYWQYQHPDPEKNQVQSPDNIPLTDPVREALAGQLGYTPPSETDPVREDVTTRGVGAETTATAPAPPRDGETSAALNPDSRLLLPPWRDTETP